MSTELIYNNLLMQQLPRTQLDKLLEVGYRILAHSMIQHNKSRTFGVLCDTIPLRIQLKKFRLSKSQKKLLKKNSDLHIKQGLFTLTDEKKQLFALHSERFKDNTSESTIDSFLTASSGHLPTEGQETSLFLDGQLVALSICHIGTQSVNATYCFFDPKLSKRSLGSLTMLLEIQKAIDTGKEFFYLGYTNSLPSQFDYKLNFHGLQKMNWNSYKWSPTPRVPTTNWMDYWKGESIEGWNGMDFGPKEYYDLKKNTL